MEEKFALKCKKCGTTMVWEHPNFKGLYLESSCYIEKDICYDCFEDEKNNIKDDKGI